MKGFRQTRPFQEKANDPFFRFRSGNLAWYHELSFISDIDGDVFRNRILERLNNCDVCWENDEIRVFTKRLEWDSTYFGQETHRLEGILFGHSEAQHFLDQCYRFVQEFKERNPGSRLFAEVPVEDREVIQGLTYAGMRLVETRVIHHMHPLTTNTESSWKLAVPDDKLSLGEVAARMRNPFDRMHADLLVSDNVADEYLRTYAMACVNGFTDAVIIPNESGVPSNSFIAINLRKDDWSWNPWLTSQIVLAAVDSETNKGWYKRLINAAINFSVQSGAKSIFNTTQAGNRAVIHTLEKAGFKYGGMRLILTT